MEKWTKNNGKKGFLNLKKKLVINFHWIFSIMKIYIICCVPAQIPYCERSCSWDIGQNVLSQSDCRIFKSTSSPEQLSERVSFFPCWYKFIKIKIRSKLFWLDMVKKGSLDSGIWLYLKNENMELTDFLQAGTNSCKVKGDGKRLGWAWSKTSPASLVTGLQNRLYLKNEQM